MPTTPFVPQAPATSSPAPTVFAAAATPIPTLARASVRIVQGTALPNLTLLDVQPPIKVSACRHGMPRELWLQAQGLLRLLAEPGLRVERFIRVCFDVLIPFGSGCGSTLLYCIWR
ncbi:hypothetical protein N657DRAFT_646861 [Parathielavia appendiculata]|uniref:Uncharacterized protein n=1 Tax=Parathielavia appendiculata TaxID=2587402 RepID=A0AAN6TX70_9PEZI|nr:hypothetical protein N657DRAFT_646861 [Parathielavia appendiculata]